LPNRRPPLLDLGKIKTIPLDDRPSLVETSAFSSPILPGPWFQTFMKTIPGIHAGIHFRNLVEAVASAHERSAPVVLGMGAHVIKVGLAPLVNDLLERGVVTSVALNGAGIIHDLEIALVGRSSEDVGAGLAELTAAFQRRGRPDPPRGMLVLLTERYAPARGRSRKLGEAQFLGRRLIARLKEGEILSRVLAHEVLHLYGAVHLSERVDSLMNPTGGEWVLRAPNAAILKQTRKRRFGPGGLERNVLPFVDIDATIDAYLAVIGANLALRRAGIQEVLDDVSTPRARAQRLRSVAQLDPHLGDVCSFTAKLLWRAQRGPEAVRLFDTAAALYGPRTPEGRTAAARADSLLQFLQRTVPAPP